MVRWGGDSPITARHDRDYARPVDFLITLGVPMIGIEPRRGMVGTWLNVYSSNDNVQTAGGFSVHNFWASLLVSTAIKIAGGHGNKVIPVLIPVEFHPAPALA